jgi:hypothetical protein
MGVPSSTKVRIVTNFTAKLDRFNFQNHIDKKQVVVERDRVTYDCTDNQPINPQN